MTIAFPTKAGNERKPVAPGHSRERGKPRQSGKNRLQTAFPSLSFPETQLACPNKPFLVSVCFPYGGECVSVTERIPTAVDGLRALQMHHGRRREGPALR